METKSMSRPAIKNDRLYTYGDYRTWPPGERWELIGGVAYNMSPAPNNEHQRIVVELVTILHTFLKGKPCLVRVAPFDVRLPEAGEADEFIKDTVQPDIIVVCDEAKLDERGLRGAPDIAIEVLSPATARKDLTYKKDLYERHGVKEYWVFHPTDALVFFFSLEENNEFSKPKILGFENNLQSNVLAGFELKLSDVLTEVPGSPQ